MPTVQRYKETQGTGGLSPSAVNIKFDDSGLRAAAASSVPEKNAVPLITAGADYNAGKRGLELQKAGAEYEKFIGNSSAHVQLAAGRAEAKAQASANAILTESSARLLKMQEDLDATAVMKATNEWHRYVNEWWNDPNKGVAATRQLAGAQGLYGDTQTYLQELTSRVANGLATNAQRIAFLKSVSNSALAVEGRSSRFEASEMNKNLKLTAETTVKNAIDSIIADMSPENIEAQKQRIGEVREYQFRGAAPEILEAIHKEDNSNIHVSIIKSLIDKDPKKAEEYFKAVEPDISEEVRATIGKKVGDSALLIKMQEETPLLFEKYGINDLSGALKEIGEKYSGTEEEKRKAFAEGLWRERDNELKEKEDKMFDSIIGMVDAHKPYSQILHEIENFHWSSNKMRVLAKDYVQKKYKVGEYAPKTHYSGGGYGGTGSSKGGGRKKMDVAVVAKLDEMRVNGTLFEQYPDYQGFVEEFGNYLTNEVLLEYRKHYQKLGGDNDFEVVLDVKWEKYFEDALDQAGIKNKAEREGYKHNFNNIMAHTKAQFKKEGKPFTDNDYVDLVYKCFEPTVVGTVKKWYGTKEIKKRYIDIPPNAIRGNDGNLYIKGADGRKHLLNFEE